MRNEAAEQPAEAAEQPAAESERAYEAEMAIIRRLGSAKVNTIAVKQMKPETWRSAMEFAMDSAMDASASSFVSRRPDRQPRTTRVDRSARMKQRLSATRTLFKDQHSDVAPTPLTSEIFTEEATDVAPTPLTSEIFTEEATSKADSSTSPHRSRTTLMPLLLAIWMVLGLAITAAILASRTTWSVAAPIPADLPATQFMITTGRSVAERVVAPLVVNGLAVKLLQHAVSAKAKAAVAVATTPAAKAFGKRLVTSPAGVILAGAISNVATSVTGFAIRGAKAGATTAAPALARAVVPKMAHSAAFDAVKAGIATPTATKGALGAIVGAMTAAAL